MITVLLQLGEGGYAVGMNSSYAAGVKRQGRNTHLQ